MLSSPRPANASAPFRWSMRTCARLDEERPGMEMRTVLPAMLLFLGGPALAQQPAPLSTEPPGASSCSGCHGRSGGIPAIKAKSADEIAATMLEYRAGQ